MDAIELVGIAVSLCGLIAAIELWKSPKCD
jgi:hypothetical protein